MLSGREGVGESCFNPQVLSFNGQLIQVIEVKVIYATIQSYHVVDFISIYIDKKDLCLSGFNTQRNCAISI